MVDGHEKKCIVVDLDGTLIDGNSLHLLMKWMIHVLSLSCKLSICSVAIKRLLNIVSHIEMKREIIRMSESRLTDDDIMAFVKCLKGFVSEDVMARIISYSNQGYKIILATAAPDIYVAPSVSLLDFDGYVASDTDKLIKCREEMRGLAKGECAEAYANERNWKISVVMTDHEDDIPLLRMHDIKRILVRPTKKLQDMLNQEGLIYETII